MEWHNFRGFCRLTVVSCENYAHEFSLNEALLTKCLDVKKFLRNV